MYEASKAAIRRRLDPVWATHYMRGSAIDIGAGPDGLSRQRHLWPLLTSVREWDLPDGDAQLMQGVPDGSYDLVHSSHCLEHMRDPDEALRNWWRILRPGGHLVILVPDEDMYEQGVWPSTHNRDHKSTWTISKPASWSPASRSLAPLLVQLADDVEILELRSLHATFDWTATRRDQTLGPGECAIEAVVRKRYRCEVEDRGRRARVAS